jgi:CubicO group peptidase (beta-lactamase class C family)
MIRARLTALALSACGAAAVALAAPAPTPTARPESVGFSSARLTRVTDLMQRYIDAGTFAGAVTLVVRHGRIALRTAQGEMDIETHTGMRTDAVFRIMSMTKPIVAVAVLMLVEDGKLRLTDPVGKFIPALADLDVAVPNGEGLFAPAPSGAVSAPMPFRTVPAARAITIRDLLTHTSGLMSGGASTFYAAAAAVNAGETLAQVLPRLEAAPLDFQPGTHWAYSAQYGFDVLVRVVELVSGMRFDRFAEERIFAPLGMQDTFFYRDGMAARTATLYTHVDGKLAKQPDLPFLNGVYLSGGGGLASTADDYLRFALMLANGGEQGGTRLLGARTVELMTSVFAPDTLPGRNPGEGYGLGVRVVSDSAARNTWLSEGSFGWSGAFNTHFFIDPGEDVVGIFMTQVAGLASRGQVRDDFETAVLQAIVAP